MSYITQYYRFGLMQGNWCSAPLSLRLEGVVPCLADDWGEGDPPLVPERWRGGDPSGHMRGTQPPLV